MYTPLTWIVSLDRCTGRRSCTHCEKQRTLEQLAQQVVRQEQHLQEVHRRVSETECKIAQYESRLHLTRVQRDGQDYVQHAYLHLDSGRGENDEVAGAGEDSLDSLLLSLDEESLDEYLDLCARLHDLGERLTYLRQLAHNLTEELHTAKVRTTAAAAWPGERKEAGEAEALRVQLVRAVATSVLQQQQEVEVARELSHLDAQLASKGRQLQLLVAELHEAEERELALSSGFHSSSHFPSASQFQELDNSLTEHLTSEHSQTNDEYKGGHHLLDTHLHSVHRHNVRPVDTNDKPTVEVDRRTENPLERDEPSVVLSYECHSLPGAFSQQNFKMTGCKSHRLVYVPDIIVEYRRAAEDRPALATPDDSGLATSDSSSESCMPGLEPQQPPSRAVQAPCDLVLDTTCKFTRLHANGSSAADCHQSLHPSSQKGVPPDWNVSDSWPVKSNADSHVLFEGEPHRKSLVNGAGLHGRDLDPVTVFAGQSKTAVCIIPAGQRNVFKDSQVNGGWRPPTCSTNRLQVATPRVKTVRFMDLETDGHRLLDDDCSSQDTGLSSMHSEENALETLV